MGSLPDFSDDSSYLRINPLEFHRAVPGESFLDYSEKAYIRFLQNINIMNPYVIGWRRPLITHHVISKGKLFK